MDYDAADDPADQTLKPIGERETRGDEEEERGHEEGRPPRRQPAPRARAGEDGQDGTPDRSAPKRETRSVPAAAESFDAAKVFVGLRTNQVSKCTSENAGMTRRR